MVILGSIFKCMYMMIEAFILFFSSQCGHQVPRAGGKSFSSKLQIDNSSRLDSQRAYLLHHQGSTFYIAPSGPSKALGSGLEVWQGYFTAIRPWVLSSSYVPM